MDRQVSDQLKEATCGAVATNNADLLYEAVCRLDDIILRQRELISRINGSDSSNTQDDPRSGTPPMSDILSNSPDRIQGIINTATENISEIESLIYG